PTPTSSPLFPYTTLFRSDSRTSARLDFVRVLVRLFASYREAAGRGHFDLELPPGSTVRDAIARILREHPLVAEGRQVVIARNRRSEEHTSELQSRSDLVC